MAETLRAKALKTLQKLRRMECANDEGYCKCVSCGVLVHWKECDGGHFIPKGSSSRWALEPENIWSQCKSCNGWQMKHGSAAQQYTIHMIDFYGREFVDHMLDTRRDTHKLYAADYREMIADWSEQIKGHERRLGVRGR